MQATLKIRSSFYAKFDLIFPKVRNHIIERSVNEFLPLNFSITNNLCTSGDVNSLGKK